MKKEAIKCPVKNVTVNKSIHCPDYSCDNCPEKTFSNESEKLEKNKKYGKPAHKKPQDPVKLNYNYLLFLDKEISRLKAIKKKGSEDRRLLELDELLLDLGKKGFNLSRYSTMLYELTNIDQHKKWEAAFTRFKKEGDKRKKDFKRILKILEEYRWFVLCRVEVRGNIKECKREQEAYLRIKEDLESLMLMPLKNEERSACNYIYDKGVYPKIKNPANWPLVDKAIYFLMKDLQTIGFSENTASTTVVKILKLRDPKLFNKLTAQAVRERFKYFPKNTKIKKIDTYLKELYG